MLAIGWSSGAFSRAKEPSTELADLQSIYPRRRHANRIKYRLKRTSGLSIPIRVVSVTRSGSGSFLMLNASHLLRKETPVLTIREIRFAQLREFVTKLVLALRQRPTETKDGSGLSVCR
jgi:hypothetical protein